MVVDERHSCLTGARWTRRRACEVNAGVPGQGRLQTCCKGLQRLIIRDSFHLSPPSSPLRFNLAATCPRIVWPMVRHTSCPQWSFVDCMGGHSFLRCLMHDNFRNIQRSPHHLLSSLPPIPLFTFDCRHRVNLLQRGFSIFSHIGITSIILLGHR